MFTESNAGADGETKKRRHEDEEERERRVRRKRSHSRRSPSTLPERKEPESWTVRDADKLYNVSGWGAPYFKVNEAGNIEVDPTGHDPDVHNIDLFELVEDVIERGHSLPLLIRFSDILKDRIKVLNEAFRSAISEYEYNNVYKGVFPIKVCQARRVVKEVVKYGKEYMYGLEAGSKPELLIVLSHLRTKGALITCNGYKDSEYVETALLAQQLGQTPIIVIEKLHELSLVIQASKKLHIKPIVGVRAKLSTRGVGRWCHSSGDHAKFGLGASDIVDVVRQLRAENMLDSLQLLHFHIGSQISRIAVVKDALREATQFFVELYKMGANMCYLDVGGGLGVDYDGSKTSFHASMNYTMNEYAADVVSAIKTACDKNKVPHPIIVSESGRAVCSHQCVLVFSVLGATKPLTNAAPARAHPVKQSSGNTTGAGGPSSAARSGLPSSASTSSLSGVETKESNGSASVSAGEAAARSPSPSVPASAATTGAGEGAGAGALVPCAKKVHKKEPLPPPLKPKPGDHQLIQNLYEIWSSINIKNLQEVYHDAQQYKSEALTLFTLGLMSLSERARVEDLFWRVCMDILPYAKRLKYVPEELADLEKEMSYIYYCNISVFQSAPDTWAIDQLFPIMPIHRLDERPTALATLADITCDSDGKIDKFISTGTDDHKDLLELHELDEEEPYYLAMFLAGAYQEVLGNLHNLFGDTNVIHVELDPEDSRGYSVEHVVRGDTTEEVLTFMEYNPKMMLEGIRLQSEQALNQKKLTLAQYRTLVKHYEKSLSKYTYLWADEE